MYLFKRHPLYLFIISIFLFISCSGKSEITIKGKILDSHGSVIPRSDVHWIKLGENSSTQHLKADPSGHFTIQITTPGYYRLQLSGVNHEMYETVLDLTSMHDVQLTAYLSSSLTNPNLDRAYAVGSFNQFSLNNARPMEKQPNGSFTLTIPADSGMVTYQVIGPDEMTPVNGTAADNYNYDGAGAYVANLTPVNGKVTLKYDPAKVKPAGHPHIEFRDTPSEISDFARSYNGIQKFEDSYTNAIKQYQAAGGNPDSYHYNFTGIKDSLNKAIENERNDKVRIMQTLNYMTLGLYGADSLRSEYAQDLLNKLDPSSPLWSIQPLDMLVAVDVSGKQDKYEKYIDKAVDTNPDRSVQATLVYYQLNNAYRRGDIQNAHAYYNKLQSQFGDTKLAQYAQSQFSFNSKIAVGKPVPDFSVAALGGSDKTYSRQNMLGKTYMIDFWATWCPPCRGELPYITKAYADFKNKGFHVLSLSLDDHPQDVQKFRKTKFAMPWYHGFLKGGFQNKIAEEFGVNAIPSPVLVGPKGTVLAKGISLRGPNLEQTLAQVLGKPSAP